MSEEWGVTVLQSRRTKKQKPRTYSVCLREEKLWYLEH